MGCKKFSRVLNPNCGPEFQQNVNYSIHEVRNEDLVFLKMLKYLKVLLYIYKKDVPLRAHINDVEMMCTVARLDGALAGGL